LDVGGGANEKQVTEAFKILDSDPRVTAILVNIFGGIMKCDIIAKGIIAACQQIHLRVPLVVRLAGIPLPLTLPCEQSYLYSTGTNVEIGKQILQSSGLNIITADDLDDAAIKAVASINKK
jgi:succinyl-CoA synthetase beta subunit